MKIIGAIEVKGDTGLSKKKKKIDFWKWKSFAFKKLNDLLPIANCTMPTTKK